jgi:hypothetical protein
VENKTAEKNNYTVGNTSIENENVQAVKEKKSSKDFEE